MYVCWPANTTNQIAWPGDLDLLTLKVVSESRVTWTIRTSVPIFSLPRPLFLVLGAMYATDRQTSDKNIA